MRCNRKSRSGESRAWCLVSILLMSLLLSPQSILKAEAQYTVACTSATVTLVSAGTYTLSGCSAPTKSMHIDGVTNAVTLSIISSTIQSVQVSSGASVAVVVTSSTLTSASASNIVVGSLPTSFTLNIASSTLTTTSLANIYISPAVPAGTVNIAVTSAVLTASTGNNFYFGAVISGLGLAISAGSLTSASHSIMFASSIVGNPSPIAITLRGSVSVSSSAASALYFGGSISNAGVSLLDASTLLQAASNTLHFASSVTSLRVTATSVTISSTGASTMYFGAASSAITISSSSATFVASVNHNIAFASSVTVSSLALTISGTVLRSGTSGTTSANIAISGSAVNLDVSIVSGSALTCRGAGLGNLYVAGSNNAPIISVSGSLLSSAGQNLNCGTVTSLAINFDALTGITSTGQSVVIPMATGSSNTIVVTSCGAWSAGQGALLVQGDVSQLTLSIVSSTIVGASGNMFQFATTATSVGVVLSSASLTASGGTIFRFGGVLRSSSVVGDAASTFASHQGFLSASAAVSASSLAFSGASSLGSPSSVGSYQFTFDVLSTVSLSFSGATMFGAYGGVYAASADAITIAASAAVVSIGSAYNCINIQGGLTSSTLNVQAASSITQGSALLACMGGTVSSIGVTVSGGSTVTANGGRNILINTAITSSVITFISATILAAVLDNVYVSGASQGLTVGVTSCTVSAAGSGGSAAFLRIDGATTSSTVSVISSTVLAPASGGAVLSIAGAITASLFSFTNVAITATHGMRFLGSVGASSVVSVSGSSITITESCISFAQSFSASSLTVSNSVLVSGSVSNAVIHFSGAMTTATIVVTALSRLENPSGVAISIGGASTTAVVSIVQSTLTASAATIQTSGSMSGSQFSITLSTLIGSRNFYRTASVVGESISIADSSLSATSANLEHTAAYASSTISLTGLSTISSAAVGFYWQGIIQSCTMLASGTGVAISSGSYNIYANQAVTSLGVTLLAGVQATATTSNIVLTTASSISSIALSMSGGTILSASSTSNIYVGAATVSSLSIAISACGLTSGASANGYNIAAVGTIVGISMALTTASLVSPGTNANVYLSSTVTGASLSLVSTSLSSVGSNVDLGTASALTLVATDSSFVSATFNVAAVSFAPGASTNVVSMSSCGTVSSGSSNFYVSGATTAFSLVVAATVLLAASNQNMLFSSISSSSLIFSAATLSAIASHNLKFTSSTSLSLTISAASSWYAHSGNVVGTGTSTSLQCLIGGSSSIHSTTTTGANILIDTVASGTVSITGTSFMFALGPNIEVTNAAASYDLYLASSCTITASGDYAFKFGSTTTGASVTIDGGSVIAAGLLYLGATVSQFSLQLKQASTVTSSSTSEAGIYVAGAFVSSTISLSDASVWRCLSSSAISFGGPVTSATIALSAASVVSLGGLTTSVVRASSTVASTVVSVSGASILEGPATTTLIYFLGDVSTSTVSITGNSVLSGGTAIHFATTVTNSGILLTASQCTVASAVFTVGGASTALTMSVSASSLVAQQGSAVSLSDASTHSALVLSLDASTTISAAAAYAISVGIIASGSFTSNAATITSRMSNFRVAGAASSLVISVVSSTMTSPASNIAFESTTSTVSMQITSSVLVASAGSNCVMNGAASTVSLTVQGSGATMLSASGYNLWSVSSVTTLAILVSGSGVTLTSSGSAAGNIRVGSIVAPASSISVIGGAAVSTLGSNVVVDATANTLTLFVGGTSTSMKSVGAIVSSSHNVYVGGDMIACTVSFASMTSLTSYGSNICVGGVVSSGSALGVTSMSVTSAASRNFDFEGGLAGGSVFSFNSGTAVCQQSFVRVGGAYALGTVSLSNIAVSVVGSSRASPAAALVKLTALSGDAITVAATDVAVTATFTTTTAHDFVWLFVDGGRVVDPVITLTRPVSALFDVSGNSSSVVEINFVRLSNAAVWKGSSGSQSSSSVISITSPVVSGASAERIFVQSETSEFLFSTLFVGCYDIKQAYYSPIALSGITKQSTIRLNSVAVTSVGVPIAAVDAASGLLQSNVFITFQNCYFRTQAVVTAANPSTFTITAGCSLHTSNALSAATFDPQMTFQYGACSPVESKCWDSISRSKSHRTNSRTRSLAPSLTQDPTVSRWLKKTGSASASQSRSGASSQTSSMSKGIDSASCSNTVSQTVKPSLTESHSAATLTADRTTSNTRSLTPLSLTQESTSSKDPSTSISHSGRTPSRGGGSITQSLSMSVTSVLSDTSSQSRSVTFTNEPTATGPSPSYHRSGSMTLTSSSTWSDSPSEVYSLTATKSSSLTMHPSRSKTLTDAFTVTETATASLSLTVRRRRTLSAEVSPSGSRTVETISDVLSGSLSQSITSTSTQSSDHGTSTVSHSKSSSRRSGSHTGSGTRPLTPELTMTQTVSASSSVKSTSSLTETHGSKTSDRSESLTASSDRPTSSSTVSSSRTPSISSSRVNIINGVQSATIPSLRLSHTVGSFSATGTYTRTPSLSPLLTISAVVSASLQTRSFSTTYTTTTSMTRSSTWLSSMSPTMTHSAQGTVSEPTVSLTDEGTDSFTASDTVTRSHPSRSSSLSRHQSRSQTASTSITAVSISSIITSSSTWSQSHTTEHSNSHSETGSQTLTRTSSQSATATHSVSHSSLPTQSPSATRTTDGTASSSLSHSQSDFGSASTSETHGHTYSVSDSFDVSLSRSGSRSATATITPSPTLSGWSPTHHLSASVTPSIPHHSETKYASFTRHTAATVSASRAVSPSDSNSGSTSSSLSRSGESHSMIPTPTSQLNDSRTLSMSLEATQTATVDPLSTPTVSTTPDTTSSRSPIPTPTSSATMATSSNVMSETVHLSFTETWNVSHSNTANQTRSTSATYSMQHDTVTSVGTKSMTVARSMSVLPTAASPTMLSTVSYRSPTADGSLSKSWSVTYELTRSSTATLPMTLSEVSLTLTESLSRSASISHIATQSWPYFSSTMRVSRSQSILIGTKTKITALTVTLDASGSYSLMATTTLTRVHTPSLTLFQSFSVSPSVSSLVSGTPTAQRTSITKGRATHTASRPHEVAHALLAAELSSALTVGAASLGRALRADCLVPASVAALVVMSVGMVLLAVTTVRLMVKRCRRDDASGVGTADIFKFSTSGDGDCRTTMHLLVSRHVYLSVLFPCHLGCALGHVLKAVLHVMIVSVVCIAMMLLLRTSSTAVAQVCCFVAATSAALADHLLDAPLHFVSRLTFRKSLSDDSELVEVCEPTHAKQAEQVACEFILAVDPGEMRRQLDERVAAVDPDGDVPLPKFVDLDAFMEDVVSFEDAVWMENAAVQSDCEEEVRSLVSCDSSRVAFTFENATDAHPIGDSDGLEAVQLVEIRVDTTTHPIKLIGLFFAASLLLLVVLTVELQHIRCEDTWVSDSILLCIVLWDFSVVQVGVVVLHYVRQWVLEVPILQHPRSIQTITTL